MECEVNRRDTELQESSKEEENIDDELEETNRDGRRKTKARHQSDVYVAQGVYSDCDSILTKFLSLKTSTFEDFVTLWKEKKFWCLFDGRESYAELLEFTEEVMAIAKSFILPPHNQIKRIGALYLMYGLYTQQPVRGNTKFRVTPQEWSVILKFVENLKAHGFIDANYIFHKMCLEGAFLTVAFSREYGLERNFRKYLMPWPSRDQELDPSSIFSLETLMSRVYRGSLKAAADKCRNKYNSIKQILRGAAGSPFQSVKGTERPVEQIVQENIEYIIDTSASKPGTRIFSNIGDGRKDLKEKAFQLHAPQKNVSISTDLNVENDASLPHESESLNVPCNEDVMKTSTDIDSSDSDFEYMMKPPSKRNARKIKFKKLQKRQKKEKLRTTSQSELTDRSTKRKVSFREVTGLRINKRGKITTSKSQPSDKPGSKSPKIRVDQSSIASSSGQSIVGISTGRKRKKPARYTDTLP